MNQCRLTAHLLCRVHAKPPGWLLPPPLSTALISSRGLRRRPIRVLTDSGEDYYAATAPKTIPEKTDYDTIATKEKLAKLNRQYHEMAQRENAKKLQQGEAKKNRPDKRRKSGEKRLRDEYAAQHRQTQSNAHYAGRAAERERIVNNLTKTMGKRAMAAKEDDDDVDDDVSGPRPRLAGIPRYEKISDKSNEFTTAMIQLKRRNNDPSEVRNVLLEGRRLINDAILAGFPPETIYFSLEENLLGIENLKELVSSGRVALKKTFYKSMQAHSELTTHPGVMAIMRRPTVRDIQSMDHYRDALKMPVSIVCDRVRDPGNLGTLIRCAAGAGVEQVITLQGCVDPWQGKVVRSAMGAHFRLPVVSGVSWSHLTNHLPAGRNILSIAGSNAHEQVVKSLEVERKLDTLSTRNSFTEELDEATGRSIRVNESYETADEEELEIYRQAPIPVSDYFNNDFFSMSSSDIFSGSQQKLVTHSNHYVLIIGGETHGLSAQAHKFLFENCGIKCRIPLEMGVESLNSASAATVLLYEMRRQFLGIIKDSDDRDIGSAIN